MADGELVSRLRYPGEALSSEAAVARYRAELLEKNGSDFIPYPYQVPVALAIAKVGEDFSLLDLVGLDEPEGRPPVIAEHFWRGWEKYGRPTLVTFNGRSFDLPLLELAAFRYGIGVPGWFDSSARAYEQPRNRYKLSAHIDLQELLTNFGASRLAGGLDLLASLLGKPGKMDVEGHMVQDLYQAGELARVQGYCRCDVLDTYFVFLRTRVMLGRLPLEREQALVASVKRWLEGRADGEPAYRRYLERWGDWTDPRRSAAGEPEKVT